MLELSNSKVVWDKEKYIPRKVYGFETEEYSGTPKEIGERFLNENLEVLKISAPLESLRYEKTIESLGAWAVLFQQYHNEIPIHAAWVTIHINKRRRIFMVKNDTVPIDLLKRPSLKTKVVPLVESEIDAIIARRAKEHGVLNTPVEKECMIYNLKGNMRDVWKVKFGTSSPTGSWILFIDKFTGDILEERDVLLKVEGRGRVFIPNPVVSLDRDDLLDLRERDQKVFARAYRRVKLRELDGEGLLKGPFVDTGNTPNRVRSEENEFIYSRDEDGFKEVMAYYHIDSMQRYIQSLGFNGERSIVDRPIKVNAEGTEEDQSWFDPSPGREDLTFGKGGIADAEDAEIIIHEYGHAIAHHIVRGFGQSKEARAMGEGLSDYLAASFFDRYKKAARKVKIGEWDAKGVEGGPCECLRRLDNEKHYPEDMDGEAHDDGEIWSASLWGVRKTLGRKKADTVILESLYYLNQYSDFRDGADAIITAEKNLYGGKKEKALTKVFKDKGIL